MEESRKNLIEKLSGNGKLEELKTIMGSNYTQLEIANYLISIGVEFSNYEYQGVYYAVHNNEIEGFIFAINNRVDVNINERQLINTSIITAYNYKDITILKWPLKNRTNNFLISK